MSDTVTLYVVEALLGERPKLRSMEARRIPRAGGDWWQLSSPSIRLDMHDDGEPVGLWSLTRLGAIRKSRDYMEALYEHASIESGKEAERRRNYLSKVHSSIQCLATLRRGVAALEARDA